MSSRDLALRIMAERGLNTADKGLVKTMQTLRQFPRFAGSLNDRLRPEPQSRRSSTPQTGTREPKRRNECEMKPDRQARTVA